MNVAFFVQKLPDTLAQDIRKQLDNLLFAEQSYDDRRLEDLLVAKEVLELVMAGLREIERQTLCLIITTFAGEPFDDGKLEKSGRAKLSGAALKVGLLRLCRKGIVFALRKSWGEQLYMLPSDTLATWVKLLFPANGGRWLDGQAEEPVTTVSLERPLPSARIVSLLAYCAREGLPLTQKGTIAKRNLIKLASLLKLGDNEARVPDVRYTGDDTYPFALAALLDVSLRLGHLKLQSEHYIVDEEQLHPWLKRTETEMNRTIYGCLLPLLVPVDTDMRHWIVRSEEIMPGCWFSVEAVIRELEQRFLIRSGLLEVETIVIAWLQPLSSLGFMELGHGSKGDWRARWTVPASNSEAHHIASKVSLQNEPIFVQPDFEIIVPPGVPYTARWELERLAELEQAGPVSRYRLTRARVLQALEGGYGSERIVSILREHAKYGVPELVEYSLLQWAGQYGRASVEEAVLFRCRDDEAAREMEQNAKLKPFLMERIGPLAWIVDPQSAEALFQQLEDCGYSPSRHTLGSGVKTGKAESGAPSRSGSSRKQSLANRTITQAEPQKADNVPQGLIYSRLSVQYYDIERTIPRNEDLYPGLQEVPNMWLKECRTYHAATRMDMIRKAMEWKACVRLRQDGQDRLFVPERVEGTSESWVVSGFNPTGEVKLSPDQWEEMQLILPGINDEG